MMLVHVIPIARGIGKETLTYFTSKKIGVGSLVTVPLRKKTINAIVLGVEDASRLKAHIKKAAYGIKKITSIKSGSFFLPAFLKASERAARYFAARPGAIIESLTPTTILNSYLSSVNLPGRHLQAKAIEKIKLTSTEPRTHEKFLIQTEEEDRIASYKSIIREEFAKGYSVFFCLPTIQDIEHIVASLGRGIEEFTYSFHSKLSKKDLLSLWKKASGEVHPILIVSTGVFFSIPRGDIKTIIVEKENSASYKLQRRPFLDIRTFTEFFADELGARLIWGDIFLRTETLYRKEGGEFLEFDSLKFRSLSSAEQTIIDMTRHKDQAGEKRFTLLSHELISLIKRIQDKSERLFILVSRRGLYPITICSDCGEIVICTQCSAPLTLHRENEVLNISRKKNIFICHKCGKQEVSADRCKKCSSWRLTPLGIGTERVEEEIQKEFPNINIFRMDKDSAEQKKKAQAIIKKFYASPTSILVGTEMALSYIEKVTHSAIVSIDSLFAIPDFRINERVFAMLLKLRRKTTKKFFIQTRMSAIDLFEQVTHGNLLEFYRTEIKKRQELDYPPFAQLIKVSFIGSKQKGIKEMGKIETLFQAYKPIIFPAFISKVKGRYIMNALIKVRREKWPDPNLLKLLYSLPPSFTIKVDPENIL